MSRHSYQSLPTITSDGRMVISRHYDLKGQTLEVTGKCVIVFKGGSIRNGTLKGNHTKLVNLQPDCLLCQFAGTFQDINTLASSFGIHPSGDGTVKNTPNQQVAFNRLNTLLPCVSSLKLTFEKGYYGFGGGGNTPQGKGQSSRLWFGHYAFYLYDYSDESCLQTLEIDGNDAVFLNVFPYYVGSWSRDGNGKMTVFKDWEKLQTNDQRVHHATEAGGFLYVRTRDALTLNLHDFTIDMNRDIFRYGGYQYWTQSQCGMALTTNGDIFITGVASMNNVTDGVMILCQKWQGQEIYPKSITIRNCTFRNNIRLGLSLSVGKNNLVENCDFISNGRIYMVNDSYKFESPYSDIDIEPIIDRPFASVEIRDCRFKETNRYAIVSSRQNIKSIIVKNCTSENTLPRWDYGTAKDKRGKEVLTILESLTEPLFLHADAVDKLSLENIELTDVCLGYGLIRYEPTAEDKGTEGQFFVTKPIKNRASIKGLRIHSGSTFTKEMLERRPHSKDRIVNLLYLTSTLVNYQFKSGKWVQVVPSTNGFGYGGWDMEDVTYDVKDGYGIQGAAAWAKGITHINNLTINVLEKRTKIPVFNYMSSLGLNEGVSEQSGVSIDNLIIHDVAGGYDRNVREPKLSSKIIRKHQQFK